jgi:hypothetical protein
MVHRLARKIKELSTRNTIYEFGNKTSEYTLLITTIPGFDINKPNAASCIRMGFGRGFEQLGINWKLVPLRALRSALKTTSNPIVFLTQYDYYENASQLQKSLNNIPHFVWVSPDQEKFQKIYAKFDVPLSPQKDGVEGLVLSSNPNFVFAPVPTTAFEWYSNYINLGAPFNSIPLACDTSRYKRTGINRTELTHKMTFVGGYWPKKAIQFDKYLRPHEDKLSVYGYSEWPYSGYKGGLSEGDEQHLYENSTLAPALSEPHAQFTGDIVERVFKVLGSGGCAVTDVNPHYAELFSSEELPVPESIEEYHEMVNELIKNDELNQQYRHKGYEAVQNRHTYAHRAQFILDELNIQLKK